jgi:hypothetical protein
MTMAVCFFNKNYTEKYKCNYEIKDTIIKIEAEYDITEEIEAINGVKFFGVNTEYKTRDILLIDHQNKKNILVKDAHYAGNCSVYGTPDGGKKTKFQSRIYFEHAMLEKIDLLPVTPKVNKIKIYSKCISDLIGYPSLTTKMSDNEDVLVLSNEDSSKNIEINRNNIKRISVADDWNRTQSRKLHNITIDFNGYIEIELQRRINYDMVSQYICELQLYMQLYCPNKFKISKILVMVDGTYYKFVIPHMELEYKDDYVEKTVNVDLLEFLMKCYAEIPYRESKAELRNIPYIVIKTSRSLEDNFLMFYRFIECYYKKQPITNIKKNFVTYSIQGHYATKHQMLEIQIEKYAQEIICLRNHYVHSGYYVKNDCLRIVFERIEGKKNPKDYTENNVDFEWIYERTKILYTIAIDIIFSKMLGFTEYRFKKHF